MAVFKFNDNVDTDQIIPGQYLAITDPNELAKICMSGCDPTLAAKVKPGDLFVAGANFGCGSSREHAPIAIKALGVPCVVAKSFARIFYRNAINLGLPVIECPQAVEDYKDGDDLQVNFEESYIVNKTQNKRYDVPPFPESIQKIFKAGGAANMLKMQ